MSAIGTVGPELPNLSERQLSESAPYALNVHVGGAKRALVGRAFYARSPPVGDIQTETTPLQHYPFDLIERYLIVAAVIELGRARAFVRCHLLGVFKQSAIEQIDGDTSCPKRVTAELPSSAHSVAEGARSSV